MSTHPITFKMANFAINSLRHIMWIPVKQFAIFYCNWRNFRIRCYFRIDPVILSIQSKICSPMFGMAGNTFNLDSSGKVHVVYGWMIGILSAVTINTFRSISNGNLIVQAGSMTGYTSSIFMNGAKQQFLKLRMAFDSGCIHAVKHTSSHCKSLLCRSVITNMAGFANIIGCLHIFTCPHLVTLHINCPVHCPFCCQSPIGSVIHVSGCLNSIPV